MTTEDFSRPTEALRPTDPHTSLLEREGDLAVLGALLADAAHGEGRLAVIEGPAGIGKTRLLDEARRVAGVMGIDVLHGRGGEMERDFGFGVVRQLLEPRVAAAPESERSELFAGAAGLAQTVIAPQSFAFAPTGDVGHAALHGLYWLVANLAERSPLLVAIDDLQWVDGPSLRFLHYLGMRLEGVPVAVIATRRIGEASPEPDLLDALTLSAQLLRPAPLSERAVTAIVRSRLGDDAAPELCEACLESSHGNPFMLGELLLELRDDRRAAAQLDPAVVRALGPRRIATAVLLRVGRLGTEARALARSLAVFGETDDLAPVAALARIHPAMAGELADALSKLGVLAPGRPLRFVHPVVRAAIYQDISSSERARMHRETADVLSHDPEQAAVHLLATEPIGDEPTVATLHAAAHAAQARGAVDSAIVYLRRALAEPPSRAVEVELVAELGVLRGLLGEPGATEQVAKAFELTNAQPARAQIGAALGHMLFDAPRPDGKRAVAVLDRSLEGLEDPVLRAVVETTMIGAGITVLDARPLVADRLRATRDRVEHLPDEQARLLLVSLALNAAIADDTAENAVRLTYRALGDGALVRDLGGTSQPFAHQAAVALMELRELDAAERTLTDLIARSRERGTPVPIAAAAAFRAHVRYLAGRLTAAEADARLAVEEPAMAVWPVPASAAVAALVFILVERSELDEARRVLETFDGSAYDPDLRPSQPLRTSRASLFAAEGKPEAALGVLRECERFERNWKLGSGLVPVAWRSQAALCHLALGDDAEARRLADDELERARRFGVQRTLGVALHAHALAHDADQATLTEAIEAFAGSGAQLEHSRALIDLGSAIRRAGKRADARGPLREGAELANKSGATALVERAREELRLAGARPRRIARTGRDALTPAELRVVELAAQGDSNKQIAQSLFVTLRTVEMHLSNSYRKLDIESREHLPAALAGD